MFTTVVIMTSHDMKAKQQCANFIVQNKGGRIMVIVNVLIDFMEHVVNKVSIENILVHAPFAVYICLKQIIANKQNVWKNK